MNTNACSYQATYSTYLQIGNSGTSVTILVVGASCYNGQRPWHYQMASACRGSTAQPAPGHSIMLRTVATRSTASSNSTTNAFSTNINKLSILWLGLANHLGLIRQDLKPATRRYYPRYLSTRTTTPPNAQVNGPFCTLVAVH